MKMNLILCFQLCGVTLLALGVYLWVKDPRSVAAIEDVVLNPSIILAIGGLFVSIVALSGLFGALRDNASLLKMVSLELSFKFLIYSQFGRLHLDMLRLFWAYLVYSLFSSPIPLIFSQ